MSENPIFSIIETLNSKPYTPEDNSDLVELLTVNSDLFENSIYDYSVSMYMMVNVSYHEEGNWGSYTERARHTKGWFILTGGSDSFGLRYGEKLEDKQLLKRCSIEDGRSLLEFGLHYIDEIRRL